MIKNESGTKIARKIITKVRLKRKPPGKGDTGPPKIRARKNVGKDQSVFQNPNLDDMEEPDSDFENVDG